MKICPQCGWENENDFSFCLGCGFQLPSDSPIPQTPTTSPVSSIPATAPVVVPSQPDFHPCPKCGASVPINNKFCGGCGYAMPTKAESMPPVSLANNTPSRPVVTAVPETMPASAPVIKEQPAQSPAQLVLLLPNGQEGGTYPLKPDTTLIGRKQGNILFLDDPYVSPLHATFIYGADHSLKIKDNNSLNGLFLRLRSRSEIQHGDTLLLGKQLLRFEELSISAEAIHKEFDPNNPPKTPIWGSPFSSYWGRLIQLISGGRQGNSVLLGGTQIDLGRERGQLTFPGDRFISAIHARILNAQDKFYVEDLGSRNGTFLRINNELTLENNDILIIGEQLLRVEFD